MSCFFRHRILINVDLSQLQRKRHIGNDIVCVVFLEADNTPFSPACIKSHFLHTFILVRTSPKIKRKPTRYEVSVVTRDEVGAYKPYLWEQSVFDKGPMFREWLLTKIVNGERASYSAPKFARMQERTRSQVSATCPTRKGRGGGERVLVSHSLSRKKIKLHILVARGSS